MHLSHRSILLAAGLVTFGAMQAVAGELCKPALSLRDVRISEPRSSQRTWSGVLVADASPCSTSSGPFEIEFTRLKETAPDLRFTERSRGLQGGPRCRSTCGGTSGLRTIALPTSPRAHVATSVAVQKTCYKSLPPNSAECKKCR